MAGSDGQSRGLGGSRRSRGPGTALRALSDGLHRRPAVLPLLLIGALVIALAAGPAPAEEAWTGLPPPGPTRWAVGAAATVAALAGLAILLTFRAPRSAKAPPPRRSILAGLIGPLLLALALAMLPRGEAQEPPPPAEPAPAADAEPRDLTPPGPGFEVGDGAALATIVVAALVILWLLRRPRPTDEAPDGSGEEDHPLEAPVGRAVRHLRDRSDPRTAVLLAYRELEEALEGLDLPRQAAETPTEHLGRALDHLAIDHRRAGPLLELADLYGRARFSDHTITADDQHRAAEALDRANERLAEAR